MDRRFAFRLALITLAAMLAAAVWRAAPLVIAALSAPPPEPRPVEARGDLAALRAARPATSRCA